MRSQTGRWLAVLLALIGVGAAGTLLANTQGTSFLLVASAILVASFGIMSKVVGDLLKEAVADYRRRKDLRDRHCKILIGALDPAKDLGVRKAEPLPPDAVTLDGRIRRAPTTVPKYILRDQDAKLASVLPGGGFVLVVGEIASGKSRFAYEGVMAVLRNPTWVIPKYPDSLKQLCEANAVVPPGVVWLKNLNVYIDKGGIDVNILDWLLESGHTVVATMSDKHFEKYNNVADLDGCTDDQGKERTRAGYELLNRLGPEHRIPLSARFSQQECARARKLSWDPRVGAALRHAKEQRLTSFMAAAGGLRQRYSEPNSVNGVGLAIVRAAVDCCRVGCVPEVPHELLLSLYPLYLDGVDGCCQSGEEAFSVGLQWAMGKQAGIALLTPCDPDSYEVFSYLLDDDGRGAPPEETWLGVVNFIERNAKDRALSVGRQALRAGKTKIAERAFTIARCCEDPAVNGCASFYCGVLAERRGSRDEARELYLAAHDAGFSFAELADLELGQGPVDIVSPRLPPDGPLSTPVPGARLARRGNDA